MKTTTIFTTRTTLNECSKGLEFVSNGDGTCAVSGIGTCTDINVKIPSVYDGKIVTSISAYAFRGCKSLTSITIPDSVVSIGRFAFLDCTSLQNITTGNDISLEQGVPMKTTIIFTTRTTLNECSKGLAFVSTGAKTCFVSGIGTCTDTNIIIPPVHNGEKVTGIGCYAFFDCTDLTSVTIPDSVTGIGDFAFSGCYGLKSVTIPDSVTEIGDFVFSACTGLQDITIGNGVTSIGWGTFSMCHSLVSITIPDSVTSIGDSAFDDCRSLVSITIPDSVASISDSAFRRCDSLKNITMGNGISSKF